MSDPVVLHRLQFAFTIIYHYLFPQLTMGLALLIVVMKALGLRRGGERWNDAARFWIRIFGINFAVGVVTGIPMEFQFGTNWARFSRYAGNVIGQTLAMEGLFAFFLESTFLALLVWGEKRLSRRGHFFAAVALFLGSWLSGYFIIATNAFMQHPVGYGVGPDGTLRSSPTSGRFLLNPWAIAQYAHNMTAAVVTASFVVAAVGAFYAPAGPAPRAGGRSSCASASSAGSCRASSSPFRPATARPSSWRRTSRSRSPRWKAASTAGRMPGSTSSASPTSRSAASTTRSRCPAS